MESKENAVRNSDGSICSLDHIDKSIEELRRNSSVVATAYRICDDEIQALKLALVMFAEANTKLIGRVGILESVAPRFYNVDGRKIRYDAPNDIVETRNL